MNIHEVLELGPIVFSNPEMEVFITINGSYLNWWNRTVSGFTNADCRSFSNLDLSKLTWIEAMELAEQWYDEEFNGDR